MYRLRLYAQPGNHLLLTTEHESPEAAGEHHARYPIAEHGTPDAQGIRHELVRREGETERAIDEAEQEAMLRGIDKQWERERIGLRKKFGIE
jgi:hypothetical protein